jgi:phenylalanyl-tRNA synthetase beta chain
MKVPLSWIREFVDVPASAEEIGRLMGVRGLPLEGLEAHGDDMVLDFEVYANRPDTLSIVGIAREIAAAYRVPMKAGAEAPAFHAQSLEGKDTIPIEIDEPDLCARYVGAVADVAVAPSPLWMQARLTACGVRPISNIVDITNYVLLELGQPMHAFDYAKLGGPAIRVRCARAGESIKTLDGKVRSLTSDMLVIADAERAQAIGGVMGGADSEVSNATKKIVFEAAWFKPESVRATSRKLGLKTEASTRFERGADRTLTARAMVRACQLLEQIKAGRASGPGVIDAYPRPYASRTVALDRGRISGLLGMHVSDTEVERILAALGFATAGSPDGWNVTVPAWRVDIHRAVDLVEEVGRHHGFEHLPTTFPGVQQAPLPSDPRIKRDRSVRNALLGMGFSEAITFGFIEDAAAEPFLAGDEAVRLQNPLSEKFTTMRPSLLPGLLDSMSHNRRHGRRDVRLFEIGTRFSPKGETRGVAFAWTGSATAELWATERRDVDFLDAKGVVEQIATLESVGLAYQPADILPLVDGQAAHVLLNGSVIGLVGRLEPQLADRRALPDDDVFVGELDLDAIASASRHAHLAQPLPRYPSVARDISILIDHSLSAETVRGNIRSAAPGTLVLIREFDRYQGKGVPDGKVSLSLRLTFQSPERTLTDEEVQAGMQKIIDVLVKDLNAIQR